MTVHPHMRGEYYYKANLIWLNQRFTPTCVGNTQLKQLCLNRPSVHPHMRGEYKNEGIPLAVFCGSPPHAWGIPQVRTSHRQACRFTPTCVGNTKYYFTGFACAPVHPHMRGEYVFVNISIFFAVRFTPTCVGNTDQNHKLDGNKVRFTPTCVGNTLSLAILNALISGSPPHAWGIRNDTDY